ncbi:MAG: NUDIX hydrolase [Myxococcota bacterium]
MELTFQDEEAVDASTVIVLRDTSSGVEVFLLRRARTSSFMPDVYVYPGGRLDPEDCTPEAAARVRGLTPEEARRRLGEDLLGPTALGLFLAGVRETFEEAGILLARRSDEDHLIDLTSDPDIARRFATHRDRLHAYELSMSAFAEAEDLIFDLGDVHEFSRWITPLFEPRRFDARFFVAIAPEHQRPLHDDAETTDSVWLSPARAVRMYQDGELELAPPTLATLAQLSGFATSAAVVAHAAQHTPAICLPHFTERDSAMTLMLPGDPDYPHDDVRYPGATTPTHDITAMVMDEGRWVLVAHAQ